MKDELIPIDGIFDQHKFDITEKVKNILDENGMSYLLMTDVESNFFLTAWSYLNGRTPDEVPAKVLKSSSDKFFEEVCGAVYQFLYQSLDGIKDDVTTDEVMAAFLYFVHRRWQNQQELS